MTKSTERAPDIRDIRRTFERLALSLRSRLLEELVVELRRVNGELELPGSQQDCRQNETGYKSDQGGPSPRIESHCLDRRGSEERRDQRMGCQQRPCSLPNACDERFLVGERMPACFVGDLLKALHEPAG
jgi:hypothetical protein